MNTYMFLRKMGENILKLNCHWKMPFSGQFWHWLLEKISGSHLCQQLLPIATFTSSISGSFCKRVHSHSTSHFHYEPPTLTEEREALALPYANTSQYWYFVFERFFIHKPKRKYRCICVNRYEQIQHIQQQGLAQVVNVLFSLVSK